MTLYPFVNPIPPIGVTVEETQTGILKRMRKQSCAWWKCVGNDGYGGFVYNVPVIATCRWSDAQDKYVNSMGEEVLSKSMVFIAFDASAGDYMKLIETTTDILDVNNHLGTPQTCPETYRIDKFLKTPNLRATKHVRKVYLR